MICSNNNAFYYYDRINGIHYYVHIYERIGQEFMMITPHTQCERDKVIICGVHICLWTKKNLNRTLEIDSPFQTFAVGLLLEFID